MPYCASATRPYSLRPQADDWVQRYPAALIKTVKLAAFMENVCFRRVQYLGVSLPSTRPPKPITRPRFREWGTSPARGNDRNCVPDRCDQHPRINQ